MLGPQMSSPPITGSDTAGWDHAAEQDGEPWRGGAGWGERGACMSQILVVPNHTDK